MKKDIFDKKMEEYFDFEKGVPKEGKDDINAFLEDVSNSMFNEIEKISKKYKLLFVDQKGKINTEGMLYLSGLLFNLKDCFDVLEDFINKYGSNINTDKAKNALQKCDNIADLLLDCIN